MGDSVSMASVLRDRLGLGVDMVSPGVSGRGRKQRLGALDPLGPRWRRRWTPEGGNDLSSCGTLKEEPAPHSLHMARHGVCSRRWQEQTLNWV